MISDEYIMYMLPMDLWHTSTSVLGHFGPRSFCTLVL